MLKCEAMTLHRRRKPQAAPRSSTSSNGQASRSSFERLESWNQGHIANPSVGEGCCLSFPLGQSLHEEVEDRQQQRSKKHEVQATGFLEAELNS